MGNKEVHGEASFASTIQLNADFSLPEGDLYCNIAIEQLPHI
jgi:hypothetical protein